MPIQEKITEVDSSEELEQQNKSNKKKLNDLFLIKLEKKVYSDIRINYINNYPFLVYKSKERENNNLKDLLIEVKVELEFKTNIKYGNYSWSVFYDNLDFFEYFENLKSSTEKIFYEEITTEKNEWIYADLDGYFEELEYKNEIEFHNIFELHFKNTMEELNEIYNPDKSKFISSSTKEKLSIHFIYQDKTYKREHQKTFWSYFINRAEDKNLNFSFLKKRTDGTYETSDIVDMSVYKGDRSFRLPYNHKKDDVSRVLLPYAIRNNKKIICQIPLIDLFIAPDLPSQENILKYPDNMILYKKKIFNSI